jgi:hypothetical protein|mmetsp:Transcript_13457/g.18418  ORF Transcript_13457/g.18418 Transcript_13457/m.18418 type:complete len:94 (+) Transcript_13457:1972-2253(+)
MILYLRLVNIRLLVLAHLLLFSAGVVFLFGSLGRALSRSHDIDSDRAHDAVNERHAALLLSFDEERAAAAEAVAVVLAAHTVTTIDSAEGVAR